MIRWYFEELSHLPLSPAERPVVVELEQSLLSLMDRIYHSNEQRPRLANV
jgi:hypothetical protein